MGRDKKLEKVEPVFDNALRVITRELNGKTPLKNRFFERLRHPTLLRLAKTDRGPGDSKRLCVADDLEVFNELSIGKLPELSDFNIECYLLPDVQNCSRFPNVSFSIDGKRKYLYSEIPIFHHYKIGGKSSFDAPSIFFERAFYLPRYGNRNYYHKLIDILPGLACYLELGLDCPIVHSHDMDSIDFEILRLLGIGADKVIDARTNCIHALSLIHI